ncbi:hypothetical protein C8F04DRAFT_1179440 [Mycena alexandri]|uniref:Uncharacterized protein n=1 Tax=Mycena alexandri TaxID=1745969 RepID=A0AAD6X6U2_9AGAR|nr:hypothetical protein C8F04DRAFT_1179440 [Mycena alexandri]
MSLMKQKLEASPFWRGGARLPSSLRCPPGGHSTWGTRARRGRGTGQQRGSRRRRWSRTRRRQGRGVVEELADEEEHPAVEQEQQGGVQVAGGGKAWERRDCNPFQFQARLNANLRLGGHLHAVWPLHLDPPPPHTVCNYTVKARLRMVRSHTAFEVLNPHIFDMNPTTVQEGPVADGPRSHVLDPAICLSGAPFRLGSAPWMDWFGPFPSQDDYSTRDVSSRPALNMKWDTRLNRIRAIGIITTHSQPSDYSTEKYCSPVNRVLGTVWIQPALKRRPGSGWSAPTLQSITSGGVLDEPQEARLRMVRARTTVGNSLNIFSGHPFDSGPGLKCSVRDFFFLNERAGSGWSAPTPNQPPLRCVQWGTRSTWINIMEVVSDINPTVQVLDYPKKARLRIVRTHTTYICAIFDVFSGHPFDSGPGLTTS